MKHKEVILKVFHFLFVIACLFIFSKLAYYHLRLITHPYALEYREGTFLAFTELMRKVPDPFALAYQPALLNNFGMGYNWLALPFTVIFGQTFFVHRMIAAACLWASLILMVLYLRRQKVSWPLVGAGIIGLYAAALFPSTTTVLAGPSTFGMLLMFASMCVPYLDEYRWRSLVLSALLTTLAFHTKLYFVLGSFILAAYLFLFVSKKKGLGLGAFSVGFLGLSIFLTNRFFETYLSSTFFLAVNSTDYVPLHMFNQFKMLAYFHRDVLIAWGAVIVASLMRGVKPFKFYMPFHDFCLLAITIACLKYGGGTGQYMAYFFQLLSPWIIICALTRISRFEWSTLLCMALTVAVYFNTNYPFDFSAKDAQAWERARTLVKEHKNILNSPVIVSFLVENNKPIYDDGEMEYSKYAIGREGIWGKFMRPAVSIYTRDMDFYSQVIRDVNNKNYDAVMLTAWSHLQVTGLLDKYNLIETLPLKVPHFDFTTDLYVLEPKP